MNRIKILMKIVADENIPLVEAFVGHLGEIVRRPGRQLNAADVKDATALLVRSVTPVNASLLADSSVSFVGTCTIGVDHLDAHFLNKKNIAYASAPGCNANSVVEYVYAALCELDIDWIGKRVGIIGCGNVGGLLHRRLRAQGVECLCYDPFLTPEQNADLAVLEDVLACDIVSLHTPLTTTGPFPTHHLLSTHELQQLKEGAVLLNCGRGAVIDNQALLQLLQQRSDLRVVLDVWESEPGISRELLDKVALGTPHIAGYSFDGKLRGTEMIYEALCKHLQHLPERSLQQLVPPLENPAINLSSGDSWTIIKALIKQIYAITADDHALRQLAASTPSAEAFAQGFDHLRKHYPVRREFHNYQLNWEVAEPALTSRLQALGFH
jgi:erythronate-4-phosphate dehydrogenase